MATGGGSRKIRTSFQQQEAEANCEINPKHAQPGQGFQILIHRLLATFLRRLELLTLSVLTDLQSYVTCVFVSKASTFCLLTHCCGGIIYIISSWVWISRRAFVQLSASSLDWL